MTATRIAAMAALALAIALPTPAWSATAAQPEQLFLRADSDTHGAPVRRIAVAPTRGIVVTASDDKTARVWDLRSGQLRHVLRPPIGAGEIGRLYGVAVHPTEDVVAVGGTTGAAAGAHRIYLFSPTTGRLLRSFDARGGHVKKLAWSSDGSVLLAVYAGDDGIRGFDLQGKPVFEQPFAANGYGLAVSAQGAVAAASFDGQIHVFDAAAGRVSPRATLRTSGQQPFGLSFSPDGRLLAAGFVGFRDAVEVLDVAAGTRVVRFEPPEQYGKPLFEAGNQWMVAWSDDGRSVLVGGNGYTRDSRRFPILEYGLNGRVLRERAAAADSVMEIVALPAGEFVYGAFDGSWSRVGAQGKQVEVLANVGDLREANLLLSRDGRIVSWTTGWGRQPTSFDFSRRIVDASVPANLSPPVTRRGFFDRSEWSNTLTPQVNGRAIAMSEGEVARSLAYLPNGDAMLGTSQRLLRVAASGAIAWQVRTEGEVRAVNVTADSRMVVTGMSDGSIRWLKSSDGAPLLTLVATRDGRWVAWTANGYFDASAGADRLAGWTVNRGDDSAAEFFSLNRFRERFNRPDVVDRLLETADVAVAAKQADAAAGHPTAPAAAAIAPAPIPPAPIAAAPAPTAPTAPAAPAAAAPEPAAAPSAAASESPPAAPQAIASAPPPAEVKVAELPPSLAPLEDVRLQARQREVSIPFTIRSRFSGAEVQVEIRVDGRPLPDAKIALPERFDGKSRAIARFALPESAAVVHVIARDRFGVSEPLVLAIEPPSPIAPGGSIDPAAAAAIAPVPDAAQPATPVPAAQAPAELAPAAQAPAAQPSAAQASTPPAASSGYRAAAAAPATGKLVPRLVVLAIGISDYRRPEYRLGLAAKDARDFVRAMQLQGGRLYQHVEVRELTDRRATRAAILESLKWLNETVRREDVGMLFFAGHGFNAPTGPYYFLPHDGDHERLAATGVPEEAIRQTLGTLRGKALVFVDTCFAGNSIGSMRTASRELARLANDLAAAENGVVVFASSSGRQLSEEKDEWGNGAFTKALVDGLSGKADLTRTGRITFKGLDFFVSEEVRRLTDGRQTPVTIAPIGVPDFAIARAGAT